MPFVVRFAIAWAVVSMLMFSYGMLYIRGKVGKRLAVLVGAALGLAVVFAMAPIWFEYVAAGMATSVIVVIIAAVVYPLTLGVMDPARDRLLGSSHDNDESVESQPPPES
jgi:hypothetical protein